MDCFLNMAFFEDHMIIRFARDGARNSWKWRTESVKKRTRPHISAAISTADASIRREAATCVLRSTEKSVDVLATR